MAITIKPLFYTIAFPLYHPISIVNDKNNVYSKLNRHQQLPILLRTFYQRLFNTYKLELIIPLPLQRIVVDKLGKLLFHKPVTFTKVQMRFSKVHGSFIENVNEGRTFITHDSYLTSTLPNKIDISDCVTEIVSGFHSRRLLITLTYYYHRSSRYFSLRTIASETLDLSKVLTNEARFLFAFTERCKDFESIIIYQSYILDTY